MSTHKSSKKTKIIETALNIVAREGLHTLTYDHLVKATGISKGGILYHFPSREALLGELIRYSQRQYLELYEVKIESQPPRPGRTVLACLRATETDPTIQDAKAYGALAAIIAEYPQLVGAYSEGYKLLYKHLSEDGGDFGRQWAILAALDGLWLEDTHKLYGLQAGDHGKIYAYLLQEAEAIYNSSK